MPANPALSFNHARYDTLNRLTQASGTGDPSGAWSQQFTYDGFGNLTQKTGANAPTNTFLATDPLTNRLNSGGAAYDNNGNLTAYGTGSFAASYSYDIENRLAVSIPNGGNQTVFGYDQANQRVYQGTYNTTNAAYSNEQIYFYGADGKKLAVYSLQLSGSNVMLVATQTKLWFAGRILAPQDRLQSQGKYFPYGEDRYSPSPANPANDQEKFATYTRDSATGLDYAYQRYYNSQLERFHSADPFDGGTLIGAPQSWNRYGYAAYDSIDNTDSTGLACDPNQVCFSVTVYGNSLGLSGGSSGMGSSFYVQHTPTAVGGLPVPRTQPLDPIRVAERAADELLYNARCASLFLLPNLNTPDNRRNLSRQLDSVMDTGLIRTITRPSDAPANAGGETTGTRGIIYLFSAGPFFTGTLNGRPLGGAFSGMSLPQMQQLMIIHEFLHWTGTVGPDANPNQRIQFPNGDVVSGSEGVSQEVRNRCF